MDTLKKQRVRQLLLRLALIVSLLPSTTFSAKQTDFDQIQVTRCLAAQLPSPYPVLAEDNLFQIIEVPSEDFTKISLVADKANCGRFTNVSHLLLAGNKTALAKSLLTQFNKQLTHKASKPRMLTQQRLVNQVLTSYKAQAKAKDTLISYLTNLTSFSNRSATQKTGLAAAQWIKLQVDQAIRENKRQDDTTTFFVETGGRYIQPSVVAVFGKQLKKPAIVIGAHMDTLDGIMPGAGDDGSGSATLMTMVDALLENVPAAWFQRPVYLIWYSAEERGLVGSQRVVEYFEEHHIPVDSVLQLDMTGFRNDPNDKTIWLFKDNTDPDLTNFVSQLITEYVKVPVGESACGYACSDHASWKAAGVPAAFPCETDFEHHNPLIHTSGDTLDRLNAEHLANFTFLALAFIIESAIQPQLGN